MRRTRCCSARCAQEHWHDPGRRARRSASVRSACTTKGATPAHAGTSALHSPGLSPATSRPQWTCAPAQTVGPGSPRQPIKQPAPAAAAGGRRAHHHLAQKVRHAVVAARRAVARGLQRAHALRRQQQQGQQVRGRARPQPRRQALGLLGAHQVRDGRRERVLPGTRKRSAPALLARAPPRPWLAATPRQAARRTLSPARQAGPGACAVASSLPSVASSALAAGATAAPGPAACSAATACCTACAPAAAPRVKAAIPRPQSPRLSKRVTPWARPGRGLGGAITRRSAQQVRRAPQRGLHRRQGGRQQALAQLGVAAHDTLVDLRERPMALRQTHDAECSGRAACCPRRRRGFLTKSGTCTAGAFWRPGASCMHACAAPGGAAPGATGASSSA